MQVFNRDMNKDILVLLAVRASRLENHDAIDAAILNLLADPSEVNLGNILNLYTEFFWVYYFDLLYAYT